MATGSRNRQVNDVFMRSRPKEADEWCSTSLGRGRGSYLGRVTPSGQRSFYYRVASPGGKRQTVKLGDYDPRGVGGLTVAQARQAAERMAGLHAGDPANGVPPVHDLKGHLDREHMAEVVRIRAEDEARQQAELDATRRLTVRQLFERWAAVDLQPRLGGDGKRTGRKDGGAYTRQQFERYLFPTLGNAAVADLRKADFMAILDAPKAAGKLRTANVLQPDLKQMLRFGLHREIVERNVMDTVDKRTIGGRDVERNRVLSDDELRALVRLIPDANMHQRSATAIGLILSTAARVGEVMNARWEHIKLGNETGTWFIPPENSKNQRDHTVHLSAFAVERMRELEALRERGDDGELLPWVFPDRSGKAPVCVKSFGKQLADRQRANEGERLSGRTKKTDALALAGGRWTAHDLRRTAATNMARLGFSSDVIDECLNHMEERRVTRTYIHDRREAEQARAFDALGKHLEGIWSGHGAASNVVQIRAAA